MKGAIRRPGTEPASGTRIEEGIMNIQKFTQKSMEAIQNLEKIAYDFGNQEVEQEHLLYALNEQEDSLIMKLVQKMDIEPQMYANAVRDALDACVKVSGSGKPYIGADLNKALIKAEDEAKAMGDEISEQNSEEAAFPLRHHTRDIPEGTKHCQRQPEGRERQPGSDV